MNRQWLHSACLIALGYLSTATDSMAALYWNHGVQAKTISLCFVGDAVATRPQRVQQILTYIKEYEYAANIRFNYLGTCAAPTKQANGNDYYSGDIRVVIPDTSVDATVQVPGKGCPKADNSGWGSWSNAPDDLSSHRACLYNLKLGDDPWNKTPYLNHTLHEFGHGLGLAHEHVRSDVNKAICNASGYGGNATSGFITPYDKNSVMHYMFETCGINGNYDYTGLSAWDKLAVHILYPEDVHVAEFVGKTVIRTTDQLALQSAWRARGANMSFVANSFQWKIGGVLLSSTPTLSGALAQGTYVLELSHKDFLKRSYYYKGTVRVLTPNNYNKLVSAVNATQLPLF